MASERIEVQTTEMPYRLIYFERLILLPEVNSVLIKKSALL